MASLKDKQIAIIGAGPGGLTLARLLQMSGAAVTVYERDAHKDARAKGATLDLHEESGLLALKKAGLMDAFRANYRPGADRMRVTDGNANILLDDDVEGKGYGERPEIDRGPLQEILLASLQPGTVVWDSHFMRMTEMGEGRELTFMNRAPVFADIVVGADGASSKVRPYITGIRPFYAGVTVVEGAVYQSAQASPHIHQLLNGGKIFALADSKSLIVSSKGDGSLVFYTGCKTNEDWSKNCGIDFADKAQVIAWFGATFPGWAPIWLELFEAATMPFIVRPQYCMPLDQAWTPRPNLTLIGDAAHLMPPFAGEGVNMAMLDALELSQSLTSGGFQDVTYAIEDYEKSMLARFADIGKLTLEQTESLHSSKAIANFLAMLSGAPEEPA